MHTHQLLYTVAKREKYTFFFITIYNPFHKHDISSGYIIIIYTEAAQEVGVEG